MSATRGKRPVKPPKNPVLTLGNFDGVHLGHLRILLKVIARARALGAPSVVYTFEPHPLKVIAPEKSPRLLLDGDDKREFLKRLGIDAVISARFTKAFAARHPREFIENELVKKLSVREVWVGHDFCFGKGRTGTPAYLKGLGRRFGFSVTVEKAYKKSGSIVSSSRIRALILEGSLRAAGALLGRNYSIKGTVVKGASLGKRLGYPTANLKVTSELVPKDGVYAARALTRGILYPALVNIGVAPTLGAKPRTVEVHLLGFNEKIYGRDMEVFFVQRLRGERKFKGIDELKSQIRKDVLKAEAILKR